MKTRLIIALIVVVLVVAGVYFFGLGTDNSGENEEDSDVVIEKDSDTDAGDEVAESPSEEEIFEEESIHSVEVNENGFKPMTIEIEKGDTVVWMAGNVQRFWIASNNHPTHKKYPGTDIEKCGNVSEGEMFDACRVYFIGENYSFKFDKIGRRGYHDHIKAWKTGMVVVKE